MAARGQRARQVPAGKPGGAGYEDAHRSATSVTGDPNSRSSPTRSRTRSDRSVNARDPMALCSAIGRTNWRCDRADAKAAVARRRGDRAVGEDAIRLGLRAPAACVTRRADRLDSARRCAPTDSRRRPADRATRHSSATHRRQSRRVHQDAQADRDIERCDRGNSSAWASPAHETGSAALFGGRARSRDRQHLARGVDAGDVGAAARQQQRRAARSGARHRESARSSTAPTKLGQHARLRRCATSSPIGPPKRRSSNVRAVAGSA